MQTLRSAVARLRTAPMSVAVVLAVALIPLIYAGSLTWANQDPVGNLDQVPAAVVNLDEAVAVDEQEEPLTLGDDLTEELVTSTEAANFDWEEMDAEQARSQLEEGEVLAVLTIPEDLSAGAASLAADDPASAHSSQLTLVTNDGVNQIVGQMAHTIGVQITDELTEQIQTTYLEGLYQNLDDAGDDLDQAAEGAEELSEAEAGAEEIASGADELAQELGDAAESMPEFDDETAGSLAETVADPVSLEQQHLNEVPSYGYGLAPYFLCLALWVGALAHYLMMPALSPSAMAGRLASWRIALRSYLPGLAMGVAQSLLAVLILHAAVGVEAAHLGALTGLVVLTSLTFFAVNQALIALLGPVGRFLALILVVLQLSAAGGTYPIQTAPDPVQMIHGWLPMTYALEAIRSSIAGGGVGVGPALWVLGGTLAVSLCVTTSAVALRRRREAQTEGAR